MRERTALLIGLLLTSAQTAVIAYRVGEKGRCTSTPSTRRSIVGQCISSAVLSLPALSRAASPLPLESTGGIVRRVEEVGGGLDLLSTDALSSSEVFFPNSMIGSKWRVQRALKSVEGDLGQAGLMWGLLGGPDERTFTSKLTEVYDAQFLKAPEGLEGSTYTYEGKQLESAILDRRSELASRLHIRPDDIMCTDRTVQYNKPPNNELVSLTAVKRKSEPISEQGFGSDEVFRVSSSAGGIFGNASVYRAARLRRRFRRGFDESTGRRRIDGIEIVTTHRVLDGVAGMELPTSTMKSILRFVQI